MMQIPVWPQKVCNIMAFWGHSRGFGPLLYGPRTRRHQWVLSRPKVLPPQVMYLACFIGAGAASGVRPWDEQSKESTRTGSTLTASCVGLFSPKSMASRSFWHCTCKRVCEVAGTFPAAKAKDHRPAADKYAALG